MIIRPAKFADIPAIMGVEREAAAAAHWTQEQYKLALNPPSVLLVSEENSVVVGFLAGRHLDSEWEIENVAIASSTRRQGRATRLVEEFLNLARHHGANSVFLEVRESNRAARSLYEKWAFRENGRRNLYYRDPAEDAILYVLEFP